MARIRTIKPEFWQDEKLAPCDPMTRLVFLGLIGMADDAGRLLDNLKVIDAFIFPETPDSARAAIEALAAMGRIRRGTTGSGQRVIEIVNWAAHQKVDKPNLSAALPELVEVDGVAVVRESVANDSREDRESLAPHTNDLLPTTNDQRPTTNDHGRPTADAAKDVVESLKAEFAVAWAAYPRRPDNPHGKAFKAYLARRKEGVSAEELLAGVHAYAAYVTRERTEPRFVKQAKTFFGPDEVWRAELYAPVKGSTLSPGQRVLQMLEEEAA